MAETFLRCLFGSKSRVKILGFFLFREGGGYIRDIAKKLGLYPSAVKRELDNLEKLGILVRKEHNFLLNKECNILGDLRSVFLKTDYLVYPIKRVLSDKRIDFAFIFGSFARGEYHAESDVDLMIIGDIELEAVIKKVSGVEKQINREINPVVWSLGDLDKEKKSGFVRDILKKGIIMLKGDKDEFQELVG